MKKTHEDNTVSVVQRAIRYFRIPVTNGTIKESLKSHSHYPTFKSICDVLNDWKVEHYPLKYRNEEIKDLQAPFIAHFSGGGGQLAFVSEIKDGTITYFESYNKKRETGFKEFLEKCSGAIIILIPMSIQGRKHTEKSGRMN
jgi:ABC-type bacteriocin/lantibiotic exporter with double-glycine peptidase domain